MASDPVVRANREAVTEFLDGMDFIDDDGHHDSTDIQRHLVYHGARLHDVLEQLLVRLRITGISDSKRNTGMLLQLSRALEDNPDELCTIYRMSRDGKRRRRVNNNGEIPNLFQGQAPVDPPEHRGEVYPGDRKIYDRDTVTIQIHTLDLTEGNNNSSNVLMENVPVIAVWMPARLARSWVSQDQLV